MVYLFGFIGFVAGFAVGLGLINVILRKKSLDEIKEKKSYRWKYGLLVWFMGFLGCRISIILFNTYF